MSSIYTISKIKKCCKLKRLNIYNIFLDVTLLLLATALILLILNPERYIVSINSGITLFFVSVFPSLLPFLFLSKMIDGMGGFKKLEKIMSPVTTKLYRTHESVSYPFIMSMISGYPIGAKIVGEMKKDNIISSFDAHHAICLSSTSGPIFVIGSVGANMLGNSTLGLYIFLSHIIGSLITAIFFTRKKSNSKTTKVRLPHPSNSKQSILSYSTTSTISSILTVAVYVSIFYMFIDMAYSIGFLKLTTSIIERVLTIFGLDGRLAFGISSGLIEMTRGCKEIALVQNNLASLVCCTGLISFGGLSIILQSLTFLSGTGIKASYFILLKVVQAVISSVVALILGLFIL